MKDQQFLGSGFLLMVALLTGCATQAPSGAGSMDTGQSTERVGGQAGQEVHHKQKVEGGAGQPAERVGGQAGEGDELKKVEGGAGQ